ncbi:MAG: gamma-glutamylcyclotransferase [Candidatus Micrarchaeota archaeon]|nr:gamma-glutamylcyclotransferase [Candidatus Micrarchaeota archaeon]MDE1847938.1 gamma-glutamylcyclotransferase [Candidatus Micrarchaeota archaeon]MDE1864924.1 gamma-glutamylcyclotransferase [Candidatus Micrarchaeota archaeon]
MQEKPMRNRCRGASLVGKAELPNHKFLINHEGYATIAPSPKEKLYGLIWSITKQNENSLDKYEAVSKGLYLKTYKRAYEIDGKNKRNNKSYKVLLYLTKNSRFGKARKVYLEKILDAARIHKFPKSYMKKLKFWLR